MKFPQLDAATYGEATGRLNDVLLEAAQVEFFARISLVPTSIQALAKSHLSHYTRLVDPANTAEPTVVLGGEQTLTELWSRVDRQPDGYGGANRWDLGVGRYLQRTTEQAMQKPEIRGIIGPPLWPEPQMVNVVQPLVVDDESAVFDRSPTPNRDLWWRLACTVEKNAWNALIWEIVAQPSADSFNPLVPVLKLHAQGFYPLGFIGSMFVMFAVADV